jgi:hypothetical protein
MDLIQEIRNQTPEGQRRNNIAIYLLLIAALALIAWLVLRYIQYRQQPKYKDCPWCHVTIRYRASICPTCAKFVPVEDKS